MYQPPHFREDRLAVQHALIRAHALGLLITAGPGGLQANYVPFLIDSERSERGTLRAHLARANPQVRELGAVDECLAVFQGPQHYISPSIRPSARPERSCRPGTISPCTPGAGRG
jgi:transcriptional regulator